MKILLWHGYLLGGTGSNVYTRALAREWSTPGTRSPSSARSAQPERYDIGGARRSCARSCRAGCCRSSCSTTTRASRRGCCRTSPRRSAPLRRGERGGAARAPACRSHLHEPRAHGRRGRRRDRASRFGSRRTAPSSSTRCAGGPSSSVGARDAGAGRGDVRRLAAHPRGARGRRRPRRPRRRGAAGGRRRRVRAAAARRGARRAARRGPARSSESRATQTSGCRTRATRRGSQSSSPATSRPSSTSAS